MSSFIIVSSGGSRGRHQHAPPYGSRFFCFDIQIFQNVAALGVGTPPTRSVPPMGNPGSTTGKVWLKLFWNIWLEKFWKKTKPSYPLLAWWKSGWRQCSPTHKKAGVCAIVSIWLVHIKEHVWAIGTCPTTILLSAVIMCEQWWIQGDAAGVHPPPWVQILSFWHTNFLKCSHLRSWHSPMRSAPPHGKSWIYYWWVCVWMAAMKVIVPRASVCCLSHATCMLPRKLIWERVAPSHTCMTQWKWLALAAYHCKAVSKA